MKLELTSTIEQFREKYGTLATTMEGNFDWMIKLDYELLRDDSEARQRGYIVWHNEELFREFLDYLNAIGKYEEMFVLICEDRQYCAYPRYAKMGRKNILKALAEEANRYKQKAQKIEALLQEYN